MNALSGVLLILCLASSQAAVDKFAKLQVVLQNLHEQMEYNDTLRHMWDEHVRNFERPKTRAFPSPFHCHNNQHPHPLPDSVHELRVEDFKVIGAMGDSITAANGARAWTVIGVLTEYRGVSWSIGGDGTLDGGKTTLANILRKYNPYIKGFSTGSGSVTSSGAKLNVAYPGDTSLDMPHQANLLISRIKADTSINFQNDWKVVTLFIGGNDLCDVCHNEEKYSGMAYRNNLREALDILHAGLPRTFVNLAMIFDITPLASMGNNYFFCGIVQSMVCDCAKNEDHHDTVKRHLADYQRLTHELIESGRYDTRDDFTVIIQPFFERTEPPRKPDNSHDLSYFAPDCFHFSESGHEAAAVSLWNNMLEPVGHKQNVWHLGQPYICPREHSHHVEDYIPTYKNDKNKLHGQDKIIGK